MDFFARHPYLYQVRHPWHWFTYGQHTTEFGVAFAAILNCVTIYVLVKTLGAVNRQAIAADRQAQAAEEQVVAARSSAAVSDAQRIATEEGARAEREHSELVRHQILSSLRPVIVVGREPHPSAGGSWQYFAMNHGEGVAMDIKFSYRDTPLEVIPMTYNIIGPRQRSMVHLNLQRAVEKGMQARYKSQDGRFFWTTIKADASNEFQQETFETDDKGGWRADPDIPSTLS